MFKDKVYSPEEIIDMLKARFGKAVKAYWWYDGEFCPCCLSRRIDEMSYEGQKALSINAFMYRERGVLIAYFLCGKCGEKLMSKPPTKPTPMHTAIEKNLKDAYLAYVNSLA